MVVRSAKEQDNEYGRGDMRRKKEEWGILVKMLFSDPRVEGERKIQDISIEVV